MKLKIFTDQDITNEHIDVYCKKRTQKINSIISTIQDTFTANIIGYIGDRQQILYKSEIYYFESVEKKCFAYTKENTYLVQTTLRELQEKFNSDSFVRINKSTIVNIYRIKIIKADLNMRTIITLKNNEKLIITRHYKKNFSQQLYALRDYIQGSTNENY